MLHALVLSRLTQGVLREKRSAYLTKNFWVVDFVVINSILTPPNISAANKFSHQLNDPFVFHGYCEKRLLISAALFKSKRAFTIKHTGQKISNGILTRRLQAVRA